MIAYQLLYILPEYLLKLTFCSKSLLVYYIVVLKLTTIISLHNIHLDKWILCSFFILYKYIKQKHNVFSVRYDLNTQFWLTVLSKVKSCFFHMIHCMIWKKQYTGFGWHCHVLYFLSVRYTLSDRTQPHRSGLLLHTTTS